MKFETEINLFAENAEKALREALSNYRRDLHKIDRMDRYNNRPQKRVVS